MLFNSTAFVLFFFTFALVYHFVARSSRAKVWVMVVGSILFYGAWDFRFVPLLLGAGLYDFWVARAMNVEGTTPTRRKRLLVASLVMNLGVLAVFKYLGFFLEGTRGLFAALGLKMHVPIASFVLPVGISFYTFQSISYVVDVYRGNFQPKQRISEFLASLAFFPHLVAGPIIRASQLLPQFTRISVGALSDYRRAYLLIAFGALKKTIADLLSHSSDAFFHGTDPHSALDAWTGALAFAGQIYGDFSGYTDMAIGVALLLGFSIPDNFNLPYLAWSPSELWRRWHMSLSSWLRDYLYIPLGGNRLHRDRNLFLTMVLGGFWHGAAWNFLLWGAYHGALLVGARWLPGTDAQPTGLQRLIRTVGMFYLTLIGWVLFRSTSLAGIGRALTDLHASSTPSTWDRDHVGTLVACVAPLVGCHALDWVAKHRTRWFDSRAVFVSVVVLAVAAAMLFSEPSHVFIYFQF